MRGKCAALVVVLKVSYKAYVRSAPLDVPWAPKVSYPRTSVMRVLKTRAVSANVQFPGGKVEKATPGRDGTTTWKETGFCVDVLAFCVNGSITGRNSMNEPGQPWVKSNEIASGSLEIL